MTTPTPYVFGLAVGLVFLALDLAMTHLGAILLAALIRRRTGSPVDCVVGFSPLGMAQSLIVGMLAGWVVAVWMLP
jgi:F0F1-type ATP synthase assembly protein I